MKKPQKSKGILKSIESTASTALPVVNKGLTTIGSTAKGVAEKSVPVIEEGVSKVYGTMATGLDLGVKGAKKLRKLTKKVTGLRAASRSKALALAGGRRTRRRGGRRRH